jgi:hypothetical protein
MLAAVLASGLALAVPVAVGASTPDATTGSATQVTTGGAQVAASINPHGQSTTYAFQYGTSTNYGSQTSTADGGSGTTTESVHATLSGLASGTTYHYRVVATNSSGSTAGSDQTFMTNRTPPTVAAGSPSLVTSGSATLTGTVNPRGKATTYSFQYGPTTNYGLQSTSTSAGSGSSNVTVHATLSGLEPGTVYHFRLVAMSSDGTAVSPDATFSTTGDQPAPGGPLPVVSEAAAVNVTSNSVQLNGAINPEGPRTTWYFEYGLTGYYGMQSSPQAMSGLGARPVNATLYGLQSGTTYHFRLVAVSANGLYVGPDHMFTTATAARSRPSTLSVRTYVRHLRGAVRLVIFGYVGLPSTVSASSGCNGAMSVQIKRGSTMIWVHRTVLRSDCTYRLIANVPSWALRRTSRVGIVDRFEGNQMLLPTSTRRSVHI